MNVVKLGLVVLCFACVAIAEPLMEAIGTNCNIGVVKRLVEAGGGSDISRSGWTELLMGAAKYNSHPEVIQYLIAKGADVSSRDSLGGTVLMEAAHWNPNSDILEILVKAGVDVNAVDDFGHTALISAVKYNAEADALERLVALGADVNVRTKADMTALNYVGGRNADVMERLLKLGADVNAHRKEGYTPLAYAGKFKREIPAFDLLLEYGADVNIRASDGVTALMKAAEYNNAYAVYRLLKKGADPTPVDEDGMSALDYGLRYAKRVEAEEETEVCGMLHAGLRAWAKGEPVTLAEPMVEIDYSTCYFKYNTKNGRTEIKLDGVRLSRVAEVSNGMIQKSFGLTEFTMEDVQLDDSDPESLAIRVVAWAKNFMRNAPVEQLFGNVLDVDADVGLDGSFPQIKMSVLLQRRGSMHVMGSNALRVLQGDDQKKILVEFDITEDPLEAMFGWKKHTFPETKEFEPVDLEFQKAVEQFQKDADVIRLEHILYWSSLIEEYHRLKGSYPLQDQLAEKDLAVLVKIATKVQRQFISPGDDNYKPDLDMNGGGRFKECAVAEFVKDLEKVLGREVKERYDIQKAPTVSPIGYYYFATPDGYLLWCICPTFGVSKISTLLNDGYTPSVNIVSSGMKGMVTKALTREELLGNPIFKEWQTRKLSEAKASYVRKLILENESDSKGKEP